MSLDRRQEVDAIRSVALFGICVVNIPFLALPLDALLEPAAGVERAARMGVELLFQGKFFVLFSFLFGWGFGVQLESAARHGTEAWPRYRARLIGLFLIGVAHAVFVFAGDILMLYALLGLALWPLRNWPVRRLLKLAVAAQIVAAFGLMTLAILLDGVAVPADGRAGYLGGFLDVTAARIDSLAISLPVVLLFNGPVAFAAFAAGLAAHKSGFFEPGSAAFGNLKRNVLLLAILGLGGSLLYTLALNHMLGDGLGALLGFAALAVGGPALGAVYLVGVVGAARSGFLPPGLGAIGSMSLTAYVLQGMVAGFIFYGYGLGLYGQLGSAWLIAVAAAVVAIVHLLCFLWLRFSTQGTLERLLRAFMRLIAPPSARRPSDVTSTS